MKRNLITTICIIIFLMLLCCLGSKFCPKPGCDLPPPNELSHKVIMPPGDMLLLDWTPVPTAYGYELTVIDSTVGDTVVNKLITTENKYILTDYLIDHAYTVILRSLCAPGEVSEKQNRFDIHIIGDVVVMLTEPEDTDNGMDDCKCNALPPIQNVKPSGTHYIPLPLITSGNQKIFKITVTTELGVIPKVFKLAIAHSCPYVTLLEVGCNKNEDDERIEYVTTDRIVNVITSSNAATIKSITSSTFPADRETIIEIDFNVYTDVAIKIEECENTRGNWDDPCS